MMKLFFYMFVISCTLHQSLSASRQRIKGISVADLREANINNIRQVETEETKRFIRSAQIPQGQTLFADAMIGSVIRNPVRGSRLIATKPRGLAPVQLRAGLDSRLPDNYTLILDQPLQDSFQCQGRNYGYYADQDNNCQVFHVCLNFQQIFPKNFTQPLTYQFSFICPKYTIFSQDSMTCGWSQEAVPCEHAHQLYKLNDEFFKIPPKKP